MGNALAMLDWPSAAQVAAGAGCGLGLLVFERGGGGGGGGCPSAAAAQRATLTAVGAAAALAVLEGLVGWLVRNPLATGAASAGRSQSKKGQQMLVVLTGCDSGLGFSLAVHSLRLGLRVVAGCLDPNGAGAVRLQVGARGATKLTVLPLDVTNDASVAQFALSVERLLAEDSSLRLLALVNNAGVMIFGEFEWQTDAHVTRQVEVNLLGTMRVTKAFCPLLRRHRARVITVSSHCALEALPGLAPYGATKAALEAWSNALRVEQEKYGVRVITLVPGSFSQISNIMAMHEDHVAEMEQHLRERPQDWQFYKEYFRAYHSYLRFIAGNKGVLHIEDRKLYYKYECCLLARWPKQQYVNAPLRYNLYHTAMRLAPRFLRDRLVKAFMRMPHFEGKVV